MKFLKLWMNRRRQINRLRKSVLFDEQSYREKYKIEPAADALRHYLKTGWKLGYNPSKFFDTTFYLIAYADVKEQGMNPLIHYILYGCREMRRPVEKFNTINYCEFHAIEDVMKTSPAEHCIHHYLDYDWRAKKHIKRMPSSESVEKFRPAFDAAYYKSHNPDVNFDLIDPLDHFASIGQYEYRDPAANYDTYYWYEKLKKGKFDGKSLIDAYVNLPDEEKSTPNIDQIYHFTVADQPSSHTISMRPARLCVHLHCYYVELISEILPKLANFPSHTQIIITVTSADCKQRVCDYINSENLPHSAIVRLVPNVGRDIGAFLAGCSDIWSRYDIVFHCHTKASKHSTWGGDWRDYLVDQTIGSKAIIEASLRCFAENSMVGCLYPKNYHRIREFIDADNNINRISYEMCKLGFGRQYCVQPDFPAGSFAWFRVSCLSALVARYSTYDLFEPEMGQTDRTLAHVLERVLTLVVRANGYEVRNYTTDRRSLLE